MSHMGTSEVNALRSAQSAVLSAERNRVHLTQDDVVERSGLSKSTVGRLEKGTRGLDLQQLEAYATAIGKPMAFLVEEIEKEKELARAYPVSDPGSPVRKPLTSGDQAVLDHLKARGKERNSKERKVTPRNRRTGDGKPDA